MVLGKTTRISLKVDRGGRSLTKGGCSASSLRVQHPFAVRLALALANKLIDSAWLSGVLSNFGIEPQL